MITTKDWEILHSFDDFETFDKLSDTEKRIYYLVDNKNLPYRVFIKANYKTLATVTPKRIYCDFFEHYGRTVLCVLFLFPLNFPLFVVNQGRRAHSIPTLIILPL